MHQVAVSFPPIKNQSATVLPPPPDGMYQLWLGSSSLLSYRVKMATSKAQHYYKSSAVDCG
jgi:hypothetical protein